MGKRQKPVGILYTPMPDIFIDGVTKVNKELGNSTKDSCLIDREKALFEHYGLERPKDLDPVARKLIQEMAKKLNFVGFMDFTKVKKVGHPDKWMGRDGLLLVELAEKYKAKNPKMTWKDVMKRVKKDLKYDGTAENLYIRYRGILKKPLSYASVVKAWKNKSLTRDQQKKLLEIESANY